MPGTIIVGVDGRTGGRDALAFAAALAGATDSALTAVRVYPYERHPTRGSVAAYERQLRADTHADLERELEESAVAARPLVIGDLSPARALQRVAEGEHADLLVVGSSHHGAVGHVLVGDVATSALHHAPCAVAVAPRGYAERGGAVRTIGVGFDGGEESQAALKFAAELAKELGADIAIRCVLASPVPAAYPSGYEPGWADQLERSARANVDAAMRQVRELGLTASEEVVVGSPRDELVEFSRQVDLLVIGSRGWGPVRRLLLGGTADRLFRAAAAPVLAVPRPADTAYEAESDDRASAPA
jgi:nucleotide-binding universal stress UspA family protein